MRNGNIRFRDIFHQFFLYTERRGTCVRNQSEAVAYTEHMSIYCHCSFVIAIIGTLMILTPGIAFTMGIRDFVQGDYLSGTIRMIDALLIAASIAIGTGLVLRLYTVLTGVVVV